MKFKNLSWLAWLATAFITLVSLYNAGLEMITRGSSIDSYESVNALLWGVISIVFAVPAALIITRQPRNLIGWLLMIPALGVSSSGLAQPYLSVSAPPASPSFFFFLAVLVDNISWLPLIFPILLIAFLFPNGRSPSPRWRWVPVYAVGQALFLILMLTFSKEWTPLNSDVTWSVSNPIGFLSEDLFETYFYIPWIISLIGLTVISMVAPFVRYRRASTVERTQIKWFLYACALFGTVYLAGFFAEDNLTNPLFDSLFILAIMALPLSIGIAILRHRLFDIDIIIRKTLVYGVLTSLLGITFFGSIVILQSLLTPFLGARSPAALVISTLAIVAISAPLRSRVQSFIDRRFFRQKYDAEKLLASFSRRTRDETDLDSLSAYVLEVVDETMRPEEMSLWLSSRH